MNIIDEKENFELQQENKMKAIKEEINFSDERKYFQNEINELHVVYFFHKKNMKMFAL